MSFFRRFAPVLLLWIPVFVLLSPGAAFSVPFVKNVMPGKVAEPHAKVEGECLKCHALLGKAFLSDCAACHKEVREDLDRKRGYHGKIDASKCESCHGEHKGREAKLIDLDPAKFDHRQTEYLLVGKHETVECGKCHKKAKYRETPKVCFSCHEKDDYHKKTLGKECADCHVPQDWKEIKFDHSKTDFPLTGKHAPVACGKCHTEKVPRKETPKECVACHKKDDPHKEILGSRCEDCHTEKDWKSTSFDHEKTKFRLRDKHVDAACLKCHKTARLAETPKTCLGCHDKDDVHKGKLGGDCEKCHNAKTWKKAPLFDHRKAEFPLRGKHKPAACDKCHRTKIFKDASTVCDDCHGKDDDHRGRFGKKCGKCHAEETWERKDFDHRKETGFALQGGHSKAKCLDCHRKALFSSKTPTLCGVCHRFDDIHNGELGPRCDRCHTVEDFSAIRR